MSETFSFCFTKLRPDFDFGDKEHKIRRSVMSETFSFCSTKLRAGFDFGDKEHKIRQSVMSKIFLFLFFDKITRTSHHVAHAHEILFS
jgi:hypothetical protein